MKKLMMLMLTGMFAAGAASAETGRTDIAKCKDYKDKIEAIKAKDAGTPVPADSTPDKAKPEDVDSAG